MPSLDNKTSFRAIGFCGADDSIDPRMLVMFAQSYPIAEFGVLFRPDKMGEPRYATREWVKRLGALVPKQKDPPMKLAAHLCGSLVNDVIMDGDKKNQFLAQLLTWGFKRVQINATAVNGVDTSRLPESVPIFLGLAEKYPTLEFIIQKNDETQHLWQGVLDTPNHPKNVVMLEDESKGTGVATKAWPRQPRENFAVSVGFAGGIGPSNIREVIAGVAEAAAPGQTLWIDMESSLRSIKNGKDVFDLDKCYRVIGAACELGITNHPDYLL